MTLYPPPRLRAPLRFTRALALGLLLLLALPGAGSAQHIVEGRIGDPGSSTPIAGASVRAVGVGAGGSTDASGAFRFEVPDSLVGVTLVIQHPDYEALSRSWVLPLDLPILAALERRLPARTVEEIDIPEFVLHEMDARLRRLTRYESRRMDPRDLRDVDDAAALLLSETQEMLDDLGLSCRACTGVDGGTGTLLFLDGASAPLADVRPLRVAEVCRVEAIRLPTPEHESITVVTAIGGLHIYTCTYLEAVTSGELQLEGELEPWFSRNRR